VDNCSEILTTPMEVLLSLTAALNTLATRTHVGLLCCRVNRFVGRFSIGNTKDLSVSPRPLWCRYLFFVFFLCESSKCCFALVVSGGEFCGTWDLRSPEILSSLRTLTYEAEQTLDLPKHGPGADRALHLVVNSVSHSCWIRSKRKRRGPV